MVFTAQRKYSSSTQSESDYWKNWRSN